MFFQKLKIIGSVTFFVTFVFAMMAQAKVITVDDDAPADFSSIQAAIDAAQEKDAILIAPGEYIEIITIQKELSLHGAKTGTTILIYPKETWPPSPVIDCKNTNLTIDNLTIDGQGEARYGIYAEQSTVNMSYLTIHLTVVFDKTIIHLG